MHKLIPAALLVAMALTALVPAASADTCDVESKLCTIYVFPGNMGAQKNADGSYTITFDTCNVDGWCRTNTRTVNPPVPVPDGTCIPYNPDALTNACVQTTGSSVAVPVGYGGLVSKPVCVVGTECVTAIEPVITSGPTYVPLPSGYVEPTAVCSSGVCHVTF